MSKPVKAILVLSLVAFVGACAKKAEPVVMAQPIAAEPTYTKY